MSVAHRFNQLRSASLLIIIGLAFLLGWIWWHGRGLTAASPTPQILYLGWDKAGIAQILRTDMAGTAVSHLTDAPADIAAFAVSPDGTQIAYQVQPVDTVTIGGQIMVMDSNGRHAHALLACTDFICQNPIWAPDNKRLIYERQQVLATDNLPSSPHIWWLDTDTGATYPVLELNHAFGASASLSPDGQWIGFFAVETGSTEIYNFTDGRHFQVANQLGSAVVWHPTLPQFLLSNLAAVDMPDDVTDPLSGEDRHTNLGVHLFVVDVEAQVWIQLSEDTITDDSTPAWSPDGTWIVFGRRPARTAVGRQLWLIRPDGTDAHPLTDDPLINHGPPAWSADGRFLLFQRYDTTLPDAQPSIWILEIETGTLTEIVPAGFLPVWLP